MRLLTIIFILHSLLLPRLHSSNVYTEKTDSIEIWINDFEKKVACYPNQALFVVEKISAYYLNKRDFRNYTHYLNQKGFLYSRLNLSKKAFASLLNALQIAELTGDSKNIRAALSGIGILHARENNYEEAHSHVKKALEFAYLIDDKAEIASAKNHIGLFYYTFDQNDSALQYYEEALNIYIELGHKTQIANSYNNIATVYHERKDIPKTLEYLKKSLDIHEKDNNVASEAFVLNNIGIVYKNISNFDSAVKYFNKSVVLCDSTGLMNIQRYNYLYLSEIAGYRENYKSAFNYYQLSMHIADSLFQIENKGAVAVAQMEYDNLRINNENLQLFNQNKEKELELSISKHKLERQFLILLLVAFVTALSLIIILILSRISSFRKKSNSQLKTLAEELLLRNNEIEYQSELISKQRDELMAANEQLQELDTCKNKFFTIIAHDIKNPVYNISRIMNHLQTDYHKYNDEQKKSLIEIVNKSSIHLGGLLNNLLQWAKLQTGKFPYNPDFINLNERIIRNTESFQPYADRKAISLTQEVENGIMAYADPQMLDVVLQNLIGNAIKFTNPGGRVIVSARVNHSHVYISIEDNGIGIEPEMLGALFNIDSHHSTLGTDNEEGTGLGLKLSKEFVEKNKGAISVKSEIEKGTTFCFSVPYKNEHPENTIKTDNI